MQLLLIDDHPLFAVCLAHALTHAGAGYRKTDARQPLRVAISDDDGATWSEIQHADDAIFGGVLSMSVALEDGRSVYRFGLSGGGIARVVIV